jgi:hypothetical protein
MSVILILKVEPDLQRFLRGQSGNLFEGCRGHPVNAMQEKPVQVTAVRVGDRVGKDLIRPAKSLCHSQDHEGVRWAVRIEAAPAQAGFILRPGLQQQPVGKKRKQLI